MINQENIMEKIRLFEVKRRRKQVYRYVKNICDGKFKDSKQIRHPLISNVEAFIKVGGAAVCTCAFAVGITISTLASPTILRQRHAQGEIDAVQNTINSAKDQVNAICAKQQDEILQPKIDVIRSELMEKYDYLDLNNSTASTLLSDLKSEYEASFTARKLDPISLIPEYNVAIPERREFVNNYTQIRDSLTPEITRLQAETPIDASTLPESILPSELLELSQANAFDIVDPTVIADSEINIFPYVISSGVQCAILGWCAITAVAGLSYLRDENYIKRNHDYELATDLCLRGRQMQDCADGKSPKPLHHGDLNFFNDAEFCPEAIAFATRPKNFDEFNRNFDKYIEGCETRRNDLEIGYNKDAFKPYSYDDKGLSQTKSS